MKKEITILYLLPFHLSETNIKISSIKTSTDIHQIKQFEMMGFWLGAKLALKELENSDMKINVIVRDAVKDSFSLKNIFEETDLMQNVNIIIGPFYGALFPGAAKFAKNNNIIIVNPFSTRYDFVEHNTNVYKLTPPFYSRPKAISKLFLSNPDECNIILWGDSLHAPELQAYKYFFKENNIHFSEVHSYSLPFSDKKKNFLIPLFEKTSRVVNCVHTIINKENQDNNIIIVPEKWLSITELNDDFFNLPHLYYFTNYFVDEQCAKVIQFQNDYSYFFNSQAELTDFTYQGYDITHYFIELFFADFETDKVKFQPLSYKFQWNKIVDGGFENIKTRLIQVKDLELQEVEH